SCFCEPSSCFRAAGVDFGRRFRVAEAAAAVLGRFPAQSGGMDRHGVGPVYRFGAFELDAGRRRLRKDGVLLPLPDRQLDVLLVLCAADGKLVTREELAEAAWHGIAATENSIDKAVSALRHLLGPLEDGAPAIEMRKRVGFRLAAPVS